MSEFRSFLYLLAKLLADVNASDCNIVGAGCATSCRCKTFPAQAASTTNFA